MPNTIKPSDFSHRVTDPFRDRWVLDTVQHVAEAMKGRPALIETDKRTGHSVLGEIVGYATSGNSNPGARLQVKSATAGHVTNYRLDEIGVIVDLSDEGRGAKWDALDRRRKAESAARAAGYEALTAETGLSGADVSGLHVEIFGTGHGRYTVTFRKPDHRAYEHVGRYGVTV